MTSDFFALGFDTHSPLDLASFWAGVLGREISEISDGGVTLVASGDTDFRIDFLPTEELKVGPNRIHFDLTSASLEDQHETVQRALDLGGRHIDVGQLPEEGHVVLADPRATSSA